MNDMRRMGGLQFYLPKYAKALLVVLRRQQLRECIHGAIEEGLVDNPIEAYQEDGGDNQIVLNRLLGKSRGKTLVKQKFKSIRNGKLK